MSFFTFTPFSLPVPEEITKSAEEWIAKHLNIYGDLLFGILVGLVIISLYHRFLGNRSLRRTYERLLSEKDSTISDLKTIISDRFEKVVVTHDEGKVVKGLKKLFRKVACKKKRS